MHKYKVDPYYPTNKNPLDISYREWLTAIKNDPQKIDLCPGNNCCMKGWQKNYARALYQPLGTSCSCECEQTYVLNNTRA